jgi:predicted enzyme related to lactoylglutathione lyase
MGNPVVHFDISAPDPDDLHGFYASLFGWTITPVPAMNYAIVRTPEGFIDGGIGPAPDGVARVTVYVEVDDLRATLDQAESFGGTTVQPPAEVPGVVSLAILADPAGNHIGLSGSGRGESPVPREGSGDPVTWFEIMGPDGAALMAFYSALFGWSGQEMDLGDTEVRYWMISTGSGRGIQGGIGSPPGGRLAYTTVYAEPADLRACIEKAEGLGAKTLLAPMEVRGGPTIAMLADPQGNYMGIYRRAEP